MANTILTPDAAKGAAILASQGKVIRCQVAVGSRVRPCILETIEDDDATQVWLRCETNGRRALLPVGVVLLDDTVQMKCLVALSDSQAVPGETLGQRMGRRASESPEMLNARLWIERQQAAGMLSRGARRDLSGRYAGHSCEAAGRM